MNFDRYFNTATGKPEPYDYQRRLACGKRSADELESDWLGHGTTCRSQLINIPTGLGKTAAVVLAWLWNRIQLQKPEWPRRLVYCLPMRTLVEQTQDEASKWVKNLAETYPENKELEWLAGHSPIILMGGEELDDAKSEWDIHPEKPAILIGTQDMLLSRALNRGYGMSRYRWPIHFGLLNNDCLWVMDETQLMGPGLSTSCQLEAFRRVNGNKCSPRGYGSMSENCSVTWYMSATGNAEHLRTRDWRDVTRPDDFIFELLPEEKAATSGPVHERRFAVKNLQLEPNSNFVEPKLSASVIAAILKRHEEIVLAMAKNTNLPARTLVICNTVDRAVAAHAALAAEKPEGCDLLLLHSRFRPPERKEQMKRLKSTDRAAFPKGQIVVATQVIEAGVDLSSAILWSEIAPLFSLVQRLGRLNRAGEFNNSNWKPVGIIVGVGVEPESLGKNELAKAKIRDDNTKHCLPYELTACESAWASLGKLNGDASPGSLEQIQSDIAASIPRCPYSLQRHELLDFFDTDANLSLGFTDVSPFVRGLDEDTDVQVLWRDGWPKHDVKPDFVPDFQRDELCSVPIGKASKARDILNHGWIWRGKESEWMSVRESGIMPGMTILLPLSAGGYDKSAGWTGQEKDNKHVSHYEPGEEQSDEELLSCLANGWQSIAAHTADVAAELNTISNATITENGYTDERAAFTVAVPWHDIGKNHREWQQAVGDALKAARITGKDEHLPFAKFSLSDSPLLHNEDGSSRFSGKELKREVKKLRQMFRPGIAHEVASALAFRQSEQIRFGTERPLSSLLAEYVIMSHHGHVRKVLRDEIPKFPKDAKDNDTVRGVADGCEIPAVIINGKNFGCASLSTDCRRMGRDVNGHESYTRGVLRLIDFYGPFRLAFFESLFRAADIRASRLASKRFSADNSFNELDGQHPPVAGVASGAQTAASLGGHSCGCDAEHGVRTGAGDGKSGSRDTRPDRATRFVETIRGVLSYNELAPLLADRVTRLEAALYSEALAACPLDAELLLQFHRSICGDLVPQWAGQWRTVTVTVGRLTPPPPHQVPLLMTEYGRDLQARWPAAAATVSDLTLELLAFAEGRFLTIHPFQDFNGRTIRVFLLELLRRFDLPRVELAPQTEAGRTEYFAALEAADRLDWQPLTAIWKNRFTTRP